MVIELDPGMALVQEPMKLQECILALEKYVKADTTVFDIGTGSGILVIAAAKMGAKHD